MADDPKKLTPDSFMQQMPLNPDSFMQGMSPGLQQAAKRPAELPGAGRRPFGELREILPYAGATIGSMAGPEGTFLGWGALAAAGAGAGVGSLAEQGIEKAQGMPGANAGEVAKRTGEDILYKGVIPEAGGRLINAALKRTVGKYLQSRSLYQSALKPSGTSQKIAGPVVETGIRERIPVNAKSGEVVRGRINELNSKIEGMISSSPTDIPPDRYVKNVTDKLNDLRTQWGKDATHGREFESKITDFEREFLLQHANVQPIQKTIMVPDPNATLTPRMVAKTVTIKPEDMTLAELRANASPLSTTDAQAIKKATYNTIRTAKKSAWDPGTLAGVNVEVSQEVARALKQELEAVYPQIKALNKREGELIALEEQLDRFVKREMNRQSTPYFIFPTVGALAGGLTHGAAGAEVGGAAGAAGAAGMHILRSALEDPAIKSRIAIALDRAARVPGAGRVVNLSKGIPQLGVRGAEYAAQPSPKGKLEAPPQ